MSKNHRYIFKSERLGFRQWEEHDISGMASINGDAEVMRYFPGLQSREATEMMINNFHHEYAAQGFTFFAVDNLEDKTFIGFIGLHVPTYQAAFMPCIEIGWRLNKQYWNKGYATEGATRCLKFGFDDLKLNKIVAVAPKINLPSINLMKKIGMTKALEFKHPLLLNSPHLIDCHLYQISR